jgi:tetratricopeptide (TPR) repeat protein
MKTFFVFLNVFFASISIFGGSLFQKDIGYVVSVKGAAYVEREGESILLNGMDPLYIQDKIVVLSKSSIKISYCNYGLYEVEGESVFTINKDGISFIRGKEKKVDKLNIEECQKMLKTIVDLSKDIRKIPIKKVPKDSKLRSELELSDGTLLLRAESSKKGIGIYVNKILSSAFTIKWDKIHDAQRYMINIKDGRNNKIIEYEVSTNKKRITNEHNAFNPNEYYDIEVLAYNIKNEIIGMGSKMIRILDKVEEEEFNIKLLTLKSILEKSKDNEQYFILLGNLYESYSLFEEAINEYKNALKINPKNKGIKERISFLND